MIVIFADGSTNKRLNYVGAAIAGFRVENNIIKECLFVEKSELSGAYCKCSVHEAFALAKALEKVKLYPNDEILIINDNKSTIALTERIKNNDLSLKKNKYDEVVHYILNNKFKDIANNFVKFEHLHRQSYGIQIVDMLSKACISRKDISSISYQNFINDFKEKNYNLLTEEFNSVFIENKTHYLKMKPKIVTLKLNLSKSTKLAMNKKKVKININLDYLQKHPELKQPPPRLKFTFN